ncbi:hypothetical protein BJX96DRAFT_168889 [Aspergillus floccosus]
MQAIVKEKHGNSLQPPQLSLILRDNNILQVEERQLDDALEKSRQYWYQLAALTYSLRDSGLIPKFINPPISLCTEASSIWKLPAEQGCDRLEKEISRPALLQVGTDTATSFSFTASIFNSFNGIIEENARGSNYLGILTLGWCYLLSAQLVEMLGGDGSMLYSSFEAGYSNESLPHPSEVHVVDVGEADESVARGLSSSSSVLDPLSSGRAFEALFLIAFAMALTIPTHKTTAGKILNAPIDVIPPEWMSLKDDLPYYMSLSCSPEVLMSTFCGAFWEPEIPCNLVSPWLHPVLNEVLGETPDPEILAFIGAIRQPNFSALWIGAVASGLGPVILHRVRGGRPPLDPLGFPWTGFPQSFMDISGSAEEDNICYQYRPSTPWARCGASPIKNCALRLTAHLDCPRDQR